MPRTRRDFFGAAGLALGRPMLAAGQSKTSDANLPSHSKALLETFGLKYPIFQAGFGTVTSVALAAAISNAGAMGAIGGLRDPEDTRQTVQKLKAATERPFFVNIILQLQAENPPAILPAALDAGAPLI